MAPLLFKALLFVKVKNSYWDQDLVVNAMKMSRSAKFKARLEECEDQAEALEIKLQLVDKRNWNWNL